MPKPRATRKVRWGHLHELDRRVRVGTKTFQKLPLRLRQLTAWRACHVVGDHAAVHRFGKREGYYPSSDLPLRLKVDYVKGRRPARQKMFRFARAERR